MVYVLGFVPILKEGFHKISRNLLMPVSEVIVMDHLQFKRDIGLNLPHSCECGFLLPIHGASIPHSKEGKSSLPLFNAGSLTFNGDCPTVAHQAWNAPICTGFADVFNRGFDAFADYLCVFCFHVCCVFYFVSVRSWSITQSPVSDRFQSPPSLASAICCAASSVSASTSSVR